jgi:hypothetical protein
MDKPMSEKWTTLRAFGIGLKSYFVSGLQNNIDLHEELFLYNLK